MIKTPIPLPVILMVQVNQNQVLIHISMLYMLIEMQIIKFMHGLPKAQAKLHMVIMRNGVLTGSTFGQNHLVLKMKHKVALEVI